MEPIIINGHSKRLPIGINLPAPINHVTEDCFIFLGEFDELIEAKNEQSFVESKTIITQTF